MNFETVFTQYFRDVFLYVCSLAANEETADSQQDFALQFVDEERALLIHRFLHEMKEPYKEVFNLRVFGELSFEKIGSIFGKSAGWARVTYYRAKKQIVEYMEVMENE